MHVSSEVAVGFAGGDPHALADGAVRFRALSDDLAADAVAVAGLGRREASAAGDPEVGRLIEAALATSGGVLVATSALAQGLGDGAAEAGSQLTAATGPR